MTFYHNGQRTLQRQFDSTGDYRGDVHVEPHHGTNMTGKSLVDLARWLLSQ